MSATIPIYPYGNYPSASQPLSLYILMETILQHFSHYPYISLWKLSASQPLSLYILMETIFQHLRSFNLMAVTNVSCASRLKHVIGVIILYAPVCVCVCVCVICSMSISLGCCQHSLCIFAETEQTS